MRILIVGTHPFSSQPSMKLFAKWLADALKPIAATEIISARAICFNSITIKLPVYMSKFLYYVDQYIFFTVLLLFKQRTFDWVLVADHGNAPSAIFVRKTKLAVMFHDTIAMRQAQGLIEGAPKINILGRMFQRIIRFSNARASLVLSNPGHISDEIKILGVGESPIIVGCPLDERRLRTINDIRIVDDYVLSVASDGWRKAKEELVEIWVSVQRISSITLVLAGHTSDQTLEKFIAAGVKNVIVVNNIEDEELASLFKNCRAFISSSREEGFCIPIIEAMSFRKQIFAISRRDPSYLEFFRGAITELDGNNPEKAAELIVHHVTNDSQSIAIESIIEWCQFSAFAERVRRAFMEPKSQISAPMYPQGVCADI